MNTRSSWLRALLSVLLLFLPILAQAGEIEVRSGPNFLVLIPNGDTTPSPTDYTNFSRSDVNTVVVRTYRINNVGATPLQITGIGETGAAFSITRNAGPATIQPGGGREFDITLDPQTVGLKTATVAIANDDANEDPYTFTIEAEVLNTPEIAVGGKPSNSPGPYVNFEDGSFTDVASGRNYGDVAVTGGLGLSTFQITNSGSALLVIESILSAHPAFIVSGAPASVPAGGTRTFSITYDPTTAGLHSSNVTIRCNDLDEGTFVIAIKGVGVTPQIAVEGPAGGGARVALVNGDATPRPTDGTEWNPLPEGAPPNGVAHVFRITNTGNQPLIITSVTSTHAAFDILNAPGINDPIPEDGFRDFSVIYNPSYPNHFSGTDDGTISILSNDPAANVFTFAVRGFFDVQPRMYVLGRQIRPNAGGFAVIFDGSTVPSLVNGTDFGTSHFAETPLSGDFRIDNEGSSLLRIISATSSNPAFRISGVRSEIPHSGPDFGEDEFSIIFEPTAPGSQQSAITITTNEPANPVFTFLVRGIAGLPVFRLSGRGVPIANGDMNPSNDDGTDLGLSGFPDGIQTEDFLIENPGGTSALKVQSLTSSSAHFTARFIDGRILTAGIDPGTSRILRVTFDPLSPGTKYATITIENDDATASPFTFRVKGLALAPEIAVSGGAALDVDIPDGSNATTTEGGTAFGVVPVFGGSKTRTFRLTNSGSATLSISSATSGQPQFTITGSFPDLLAPGEHVDITITFDPDVNGGQSSLIRILSDDADEATFDFMVSGTGGVGGPDISVVGDNSTVFTSGQTTVTARDGTDFGTVPIGGGAVSRTFRLENHGNGELNVTALSDNHARFNVSAIPAAPLEPGDAHDFTVNFSPDRADVQTAVISITSNDPDTPAFTFTVGGAGSTQPPAEPEINVFGAPDFSVPIISGDTTPRRADRTDFGRAEAGQSITRTFRIFNAGTGPLHISNAGIPGIPGAVTGVAATIPAGEFDNFNVTLTGASPGITDGVVTVLSDDASEATYSFAVELEVTAPAGTLAISDVNTVGNKLSLTFTSVPDRNYRIQASNDLQSGNWSAVNGLTGIPGDELPQTFLIPRSAGITRRFFRVVEE